MEGTMWELQQDKSDWSTGSSDPNSWQPFSDEAKSVTESASKGNNNTINQSVRTRSKLASAAGTQGFEAWGFETESFRAATPSSTATSSSATQRSMGSGNTSQRYGSSKMRDNQKAAQPAGWAGF